MFGFIKNEIILRSWFCVHLPRITGRIKTRSLEKPQNTLRSITKPIAASQPNTQTDKLVSSAVWNKSICLPGTPQTKGQRVLPCPNRDQPSPNQPSFAWSLQPLQYLYHWKFYLPVRSERSRTLGREIKRNKINVQHLCRADDQPPLPGHIANFHACCGSCCSLSWGFPVARPIRAGAGVWERTFPQHKVDGSRLMLRCTFLFREDLHRVTPRGSLIQVTLAKEIIAIVQIGGHVRGKNKPDVRAKTSFFQTSKIKIRNAECMISHLW